MSLSALEKLRLYSRPPGKGIWTQSTGGGYAMRLLASLYGIHSVKDIQSAWEDSLQKIRRVDTIVVGVPSDTGAGILRGANFGPIGIREAYLKKYSAYPKHVLDVGDVICVPQLLHDEMLNDSQIRLTRRELYPGHENEDLAVSPLSVAEQVLFVIHELNPRAKIILLGGDHSVSWPAMLLCRHRFGNDFGCLHLDAHSDMWESRLGIKYCFSTWAYHAHRLMKPHHLVQVGIRTSLRTKEEWEKRHPIAQFWAEEVKRNPADTIVKIVKTLKENGVSQLYISNDIDATDSPSAPATGTPEEAGLAPWYVLELIRAARKEFEVIGADVVELAPPLSGLRDFATEKTCVLAAQYLHSMID